MQMFKFRMIRKKGVLYLYGCMSGIVFAFKLHISLIRITHIHV